MGKLIVEGKKTLGSWAQTVASTTPSFLSSLVTLASLGRANPCMPVHILPISRLPHHSSAAQRHTFTHTQPLPAMRLESVCAGGMACYAVKPLIPAPEMRAVPGADNIGMELY